jgi:hypothetical protein
VQNVVLPNHARKCRASTDFWKRMLNHRVRGFATKDTLEPDTFLSYNMYRPDIPVVRKVSEVQRPRKVRRTRAQIAAVGVTHAHTRVMPIMMDDPRFGNHDELASGDA